MQGRLPCQHASMMYTGARATTVRALPAWITFHMLYKGQCVCNLCRGGVGQSHRATHCFLVYDEEQCFRTFVSFVLIC